MLEHATSRHRAGRRPHGVVLSLPTLLWTFSLLLVPLFIVITYGFADLSPFGYTFDPPTLEWYSSALDPRGRVFHLAIRTMVTSMAATLLALCFGYGTAYFIARIAPVKWRGFLLALTIIPLWISSVVRVYSLVSILGPGGLLEGLTGSFLLGPVTEGFGPWPGLRQILSLGSPHAVVLGLVYTGLPLMVVPIYASLVTIDPLLFEAAENLGAGPTDKFLRITMPLTLRGAISGMVLFSLASMGAFVEPGLLGGASFPLLGNYIEEGFQTPFGIPRMAAASAWLLIVGLPLVAIYAAYGDVASQEPRRPRLRIISRRVPLLLSRSRLVSTKWIDHFIERTGTWVLASLVISTTVASYAPLAYMTVLSFNRGDTRDWQGFGLDWYLGTAIAPPYDREGIFSDPEIRSALATSLVAGSSSTALALILGGPAAYALARHRARLGLPFRYFISLGLAVPGILLGLGLFLFVSALNSSIFELANWEWQTGLGTIVLGHATFNLPVAFVVIYNGFIGFDWSLEEAAMDLGARKIRTFLTVTLPNIAPHVVSAGLLCFAFSFEDLPVSLFLQGQGARNLPVVIWELLTSRPWSLKVNAASTLVLVVSAVTILVGLKIGRAIPLWTHRRIFLPPGRQE